MYLHRLIAAAFVAAAWGVLAASASHAETMGFEGVAAPGGAQGFVTPYTESGFTLTASAGGNVAAIFDSAHSTNDNGTDIFGWNGILTPVLVLTVASTSGSDFSFDSIDLAFLNTSTIGSHTVRITGNKSGGGTVTQDLAMTQTWTTHALSGFTGLSSATIGFTTQVAAYGAMDNLVFNAGNPVPEPEAIALLALGLIGLAVARRGRREAA